MQKTAAQRATPLVLILILAVMAVFLSIRSGKDEVRAPAGAGSAPAELVEEIPAVGEPVVTAKTDTTVAKVSPRPWAHEGSDIAPDSRAVFGALENGMRYLIYPNSEPPKRVSLRLHIAAGSLMEAEDQRGLAHFLEHMVFNGTKNYSAADLIPRMQRLGIAFGAHANAYTSFDETVYMLDLPDLSEDTMKLAFTVMRDFGDGALLEAEEIEKERGVILAEKVSRDSVNYRLMEQQFADLLPDSLLTKRFPIGIEEVIKNAPRERFVDFYTRYYTPERMTFVVVGDIDAEEVRKRIEATFGSMSNPAEPGTEPDLGSIRQPEGLETAVYHDKEVASTDVSLMLVRPYEEKPDTAATRAAKLPLDIAQSIIGRRFDRISKEENSPVSSGSASDDILFNHLELGSISVTAADDRWQDAVPVLEQEFRRALEFGFNESELAEAKSNILNSYEQQVKQKETRKSEGIATVLVQMLNRKRVFSEPEADLEIVRAALDEIDAAACHQAFKKFWESAGYHLVLTTKEKPENAEQELAALFEDSRGVPVEAPPARAIQVFDYVDFGKSGTVRSRNEIEDLGISQWVLSNQVRVNLKRTDFERGRIRLHARVGAGKLTMPEGMPMLDLFAQSVFEGGGLGKHSVDDLRQILAGRNVGVSLGIDDDAFILEGSTTPADFELQAQLMCASLIDPGYRNEALWQFQKALPMLQQQLRHTSEGPLREMEAWIRGGGHRFEIAPMEKLASYTLEDARKWLTPELSKGYLEVSIIGDFDLQAIEGHLLATFGALPARAGAPPTLDEARRVKPPEPPASKTFTYQSKVPQGIAATFWKVPGMRRNQKEFRRFSLLGFVLADRLREEIREKLGVAYSPDAGATGSDALEGVGFILSQSAGKPEDVELLLDTMRDLAGNLASQGASEDEFERALNPVLGMLDQTLRDNGYWLRTVMGRSQEEPERIELARNRDADYRSITLAEINALAKKYFTAENALRVTIKAVE